MFDVDLTLYDLGPSGNLFHSWILRYTELRYSRMNSDGMFRTYSLRCSAEALRHILFLFEQCDPFFDLSIRHSKTDKHG